MFGFMFTFFCLAAPVLSYSVEAPKMVCTNGLTPGHQSAAQTSESPYKFSGADSVKSGKRITITLSGEGFLGYVLQAHSDKEEPVGVFKIIEHDKSARFNWSAEGDTLSFAQLDKKPMNSVKFQWLAPADYKGNVKFVATVIKNYSVFLVSYKNIALATFLNNKIEQRFLVCSAVQHRTETVRSARPRVIEGDAEYIVPYKPEAEKRDKAKELIDILRHKFHLSKDEVEQIMNDEVVLKLHRQKSLTETMDVLCLEGIKKQYFLEYPWLITLDKKGLTEKINLLKSLNGFRDINDFVPFLLLKAPRLRKLVAALNRETKFVKNGNRVYFIADKLNLPACVVTKYLVKRLFVLEMPLEMFETNLNHMISYNVEPMNILKDLWGFRYAPRAVEMRLKRAMQAKKDKIMPWMVRCPETILQKSLQLSLDELEILGDDTTVAEYVGKRLGFSPEEAKAIMDKHPQVKSVRVTKIKEVLDYLLDEAKFTRFEIAHVPRILCHSLKTTKQRIEELKTYGCRPSSLVIVCRSKREYEKFLKEWQQNYKG